MAVGIGVLLAAECRASSGPIPEFASVYLASVSKVGKFCNPCIFWLAVLCYSFDLVPLDIILRIRTTRHDRTTSRQNNAALQPYAAFGNEIGFTPEAREDDAGFLHRRRR